ncbi:TSUP family transporter [Marimonas sp. MJW-29]|uniref:Probable membrane transporter protein n=1 Tax=Sulfitobacter sediminis TaxID=3234186 RepID=A0ABV3RLM3_9RHOB
MSILSILPLLAWGAFVGIVFSTIGAAGGILASFGLITLFGLVDPNSVKPMAQLLVLAATITFIPGYLRRSRLVLPLGLLLGGGGLVGAYVGSTLSSYYLSDMNTFRPLFGVLTLAIAAQIFWKLYRTHSDAQEAVEKPHANFDHKVYGVSTSWRFVAFTFASENDPAP